MNIGALRHRVTIQTRTGAQDEGGGRGDTWSDKATTWANVEPAKANEITMAEQKRQEVTHKVTMRYRDDINKGNRLLYKSRVLSIVAIINAEERNRVLHVFCTES